MSKAEERALEAYHHYTAENISEVNTARHFYAKGYEQAEKDINKEIMDKMEEYQKAKMSDIDYKIAIQEYNQLEEDIDWESFRRETARELLRDIVSGDKLHCPMSCEEAPKLAVQYTDELIKQLKAARSID